MNDSDAGTEKFTEWVTEPVQAAVACRYRPDCGDLAWSYDLPVLKYLKPALIDIVTAGELYKPLTFVSGNPWRALKHMRIRFEHLRHQHEDPETDRKEDAWMPCGIFSAEGFTRYLPDEPRWHMARDAGFVEWTCEQDREEHRHRRKERYARTHQVRIKDEWDFYLSETGKLLMGSGYSKMCYPHDGSRGLVLCQMDLANGDELLVAIWEWYNK